MRLAAGAALTGAAGIALGRGTPAYAAGCTLGNCSAWWDKCDTWCYNNGHPDPNDWCHESCDNMLNQCEECCQNGGDYSQCVPPDPPAKASLVNYGNALLVAAELGYSGNNNGMLRARTGGSAGPWEKFDILDLSNGLVALRGASNGLYVSAELGYTGNLHGMLRARASSIGPWEQFTLAKVATGTGISNRLQGPNGLWVSAELGYTGDLYGMLRARASSVGPWEQYGWQPVPA